MGVIDWNIFLAFEALINPRIANRSPHIHVRQSKRLNLLLLVSIGLQVALLSKVEREVAFGGGDGVA